MPPCGRCAESAGSTVYGGSYSWTNDVWFGRGHYGAMPVSASDIRFYNKTL